VVLGTPSDPKTLRGRGFQTLASRLQVRKTLTAFGQALKIAEDTPNEVCSVFLDVTAADARLILSVYGYAKHELEQATSH